MTLEDLDAAEEKGQARAFILDNRVSVAIWPRHPDRKLTHFEQKLYVKSYAEEQQGTRTKAILAAIRPSFAEPLHPNGS